MDSRLKPDVVHNVVPGSGTECSQAKPVKETPGKLVDRTLGCRYELKYIITESKAEAVAQFIRHYIDLDRYSKLQPDGYYPIVSLYVDSPSLILCRETLTGKKNRFKLRIRSYSDDEQYPVFFEVKRRINRVIVKTRAAARHQDIPLLLAGRTLPRQDFRSNQESLDQFQFYAHSIGAGPVILIRYLRKAFEGQSEDRVRVTFDKQLCYKVVREPKVSLNGSAWQHSPVTLYSRTILEIKYTSRYPAWLNELVRCLDLPIQSVSKYATSIRHSSDLGFCGPVED